MQALHIEFTCTVNPNLGHLNYSPRPYDNACRRGALRYLVFRTMVTGVKRHAHLHLRLQQHDGAQDLVTMNSPDSIDDSFLAEMPEQAMNELI